MNKYQIGKEKARQEAIDWQLEVSQRNVSYVELGEATDYFEHLGRRYGLLREFRENGIL